VGGENLYLHEVVDVVGQGASPYMAHTAGSHADTAADRGLTLLGTWQVVGATGRWPQVVNVWQMVDAWDGWERLVGAANVRREANAELNAWWDEAYQWRTGGFDRLLAAVDGTPTLDELVADGVRGEVFLHEISHVRVGAVRDYLRATVESRRPVMADHNHRLVGAYEVVMSDTEAITIWATDLGSHVDLMRKTEVDERLRAWRTEARSWITSRREELMVPHPGTPLAPA
jgi:hypothetical protein